MAENKSHAQSRDGIAVAGVKVRDRSQFNLVNNTTHTYGHNTYDPNQKLAGSLLMLVMLLTFVGLTALSHSLEHPGVEKWMNVSTTLGEFVPDAKTEYDRSTNELKSLTNELETIRKKLAFKADVFNSISVEDQSQLAYIQKRIDAARESQKRQSDYIIRFLITRLQSRTLVAKGFDNNRQQWKCPPQDYWEYLKLSGDLTDTTLRITGGRSGQVHLGQVQFGKPLGSGPDELCQASDDGTMGR